MIRVRVVASIIAIVSLALLAAVWPEAIAGVWEWGILAILFACWTVALWTSLPVFGSVALFVGFLVTAVLTSFEANPLLMLAAACLMLIVWMQSCVLQIAPPKASSNQEMRLVRNLMLYALLISGVSLILGVVALSVHLSLPFFFAFIGGAAVILLASRLVVWLRHLAQ